MSEKKEVVKSKELAEKFANEFQLTAKQGKAAVEMVSAAIVDALKQGKVYDLANVGKFEVRERAARQGRNPMTGEVIEIPASKKIKFRPCKALKDSVK